MSDFPKYTIFDCSSLSAEKDFTVYGPACLARAACRVMDARTGRVWDYDPAPVTGLDRAAMLALEALGVALAFGALAFGLIVFAAVTS